MQRTSIRDWRKHRGLTLERVAHDVGMSTSNLSRMERALIPYNQEDLEALAGVLGCQPSDLLMPFRGGKNSSTQVKLITAANGLSEHQQRAVIDLIESMTREVG